MTDETILSVEDLVVDFETDHGIVHALRGVSFRLRRGEALGIVGESGSGKTVACRAILRLLAENASIKGGRIWFENQDVLALDAVGLSRLRGERIAMIFQNPSTHLDPLMTAGKQVGEALRVHRGVSKGEARRQAIKLLADMRIAESERRVDTFAHELSGGMRQRVMIAAALACSPSILIADEPTTSLDVTIQAQILDLLRGLRRERGLSMILVSHDLGVIAQMCDHVVVMKDGRVVETGSVEEVIGRPREEYTRRLIASQPFLMAPASAPASLGEPILALEGLSVHYGLGVGFLDRMRHHGGRTIRAVDNLDLAVGRGEALGIVGESGSGKSTIARAIVGLAPVCEGAILCEGQRVDAMAAEQRLRFRRAVQMVFQDPFTSLNPMFTVSETLAEPLRQHGMRPERDIGLRIDELLAMVDLQPDLKRRRPGQLSGGQRQRVGIARALALEPRVLIADEVTSALDVTIQAQILGLFARLRRSMDLTLILISHDLAVVRHLCERIVVMRHGRLVEAGRTERIFAAPEHDYTRELLAAIPRVKAMPA